MFENLQGSRREDTRNQSENSSDHTGWEGRNEKDTQFFATQSVAEIVRERERDPEKEYYVDPDDAGFPGLERWYHQKWWPRREASRRKAHH